MVERPVVGWPRMDVDWGELGQGTGLLGASMEMTSGSPAPPGPCAPARKPAELGGSAAFRRPPTPLSGMLDTRRLNPSLSVLSDSASYMSLCPVSR